MPEGDTIRRLAHRLAPLVGQVLERVTTQGLERDLAGRTVTSVDAHGKHLLVDLDDGTQLRAHLGMNGRVRQYPRAAGDAVLARISPGRASLAIVTNALVVLWINARTIEIAARRAPMRESGPAHRRRLHGIPGWQASANPSKTGSSTEARLIESPSLFARMRRVSS